MSLLEAQRAIATNWLEALPVTAAARAADHNAGGTGTDRSASSAAGERSGDHFGFWIQTWWACHRWRPYRTRQEPRLDKSASYEYAAPGEYRIVVKVIDILGNDTTKTLKIEVT